MFFTFKAKFEIDRNVGSGSLECLNGMNPAQNRSLVVGGTSTVETTFMFG